MKTSVRMSDEEYCAILEKAKTQGKSLNRFFLDTALGAPVSPVSQKQLQEITTLVCRINAITPTIEHADVRDMLYNLGDKIWLCLKSLA